jgi:HEAT repeat protein
VKANTREVLSVVLLAAALVVFGSSDCEAAGVDDASVDELIKIVETLKTPAVRHSFISEQEWERRKDTAWAWLRAEALQELTARGPKAVVPLMGLVKNAKANSVKIAALSALSQMKNPASLKPAAALLLELLGSKNPGLRYLAVKTLGRMKLAKATALIEKLTADPEDRIKIAAADALGAIGNFSSVKPLLLLVDYGKDEAGDKDVDKKMEKSEKKAVRLHAIAALGKIGAVLEVVPELIKKLRSDDKNEREVAVDAIDDLLGYDIRSITRWLVALTPKQRAPIIKAFEDWWKKTLAAKKFPISRELELTVRVNILAGQPWQSMDVRRRALEIIAKMANPKAVDYLIFAMNAKSKNVPEDVLKEFRKFLARTAKKLSTIHIQHLDTDTEAKWSSKVETFKLSWRGIREKIIREWEKNIRRALIGNPTE